MRKLAAKASVSVVLMLLLCALTLGQGQEKKKKELSKQPATGKVSEELLKAQTRLKAAVEELGLEATLTQALQNNPDIRVAEAKLHEAEAELQRTRLQVAQKTITLHHSLESERTAVKQIEEKLTWSKRMFEKGFQTPEMVATAEAALSQAKSKLAALEAEMPALLGKLPRRFDQTSSASSTLGDYLSGLSNLGLTRELANRVHPNPGAVAAFSPGGKVVAVQDKDGQVIIFDAATGIEISRAGASNFVFPQSASPPARGAMADKIRQALDKPVTLNMRDKSLDDILKAIQLQAPGIPFHMAYAIDALTQKTSFAFEQVPLGAVLQAFEDTMIPGQEGFRLVVREYGILVTTRSSIPERAQLLQDFWKGRDGADKARSKAARSSNTAPLSVEGVIQEVDAKNGLVRINIGSDAGIEKGQVLDVFRLKPQAAYLGKLEIVEIEHTQALGKSQARPPAALQPGDRVSAALANR